jgi:hypothetical protein
MLSSEPWARRVADSRIRRFSRLRGAHPDGSCWRLPPRRGSRRTSAAAGLVRGYFVLRSGVVNREVEASSVLRKFVDVEEPGRSGLRDSEETRGLVRPTPQLPRRAPENPRCAASRCHHFGTRQGALDLPGVVTSEVLVLTEDAWLHERDEHRNGDETGIRARHLYLPIPVGPVRTNRSTRAACPSTPRPRIRHCRLRRGPFARRRPASWGRPCSDAIRRQARDLARNWSRVR